MAIRRIPLSQQGVGNFNNGEIIENKPIGFPRDGSLLKPYSNLFYWAHAKARTDSTIGLHPHQGFEICSFVLKGQIRHFDTQFNDWRPLRAGDAQIIRAGSGISHSEWMGQGAEMFQIWFDPGIERTISQAASYDDYPASVFPQTTPSPGVRLTTILGDNSPFRMDSPGIQIQKIDLDDDTVFDLALPDSAVASIYVLSGEVQMDDTHAQKSDFLVAYDQNVVRLRGLVEAELFVIVSPVALPYRTYSELRRLA